MGRRGATPEDRERAVRLYREGANLREVAALMRRSHEWVRKTVAKAGKPLRDRGRAAGKRPDCALCKNPCPKLNTRFCSRDCLSKSRRTEALAKLDEAIRVLNEGGSYATAAEKSGFKSAWHLWGRMHHFGLIDSKNTSKPEKQVR